MIHDFATQKRQNATRIASRHQAKKPPARLAAVLVGSVLIGALGFSQLVSALSEDINATVAEASAKKQAERAMKAQIKAEKQRVADERRIQRKIEEDKAMAEKSAGYDFYEDLVGSPWPVPVASDAYTNKAPLAAVKTSAEEEKTIEYSLQAALYREQAEALATQGLIRKMGYSAAVDDVKVKAGGVLFRVTVGPFQGLEKATEVREVLAGKNLYAQVFRKEG